MGHWILPQCGIPTSVTTVQRATNSEKQTNEMKKRMDDFQSSVQSGWDARTSEVESPPTDEQNIPSLEKEDEEFTEESVGQSNLRTQQLRALMVNQKNLAPTTG